MIYSGDREININMKKPWSISTTVRNPERIREFLKILKLMEGEKWTRSNQRKFQILLIQFKVYGYGNQQFYSSLSQEHMKLMNNEDPITFKQAEEILTSKNYEGGGDMRGRQSFNPLEKMGLVFIDNQDKICLSAVGNIFLKEKYDLGDVFFRSFLKWQLPNPDSKDFRKKDGFYIKPFVSSLQLIKKVNEMWLNEGNDPTGLSRKEFSLFVPTLINYEDVESYAKKIIQLRKKLKKETDKKTFFQKYSFDYISRFLGTEDQKIINKTLNNLKDYSDNIVRYFRLTRHIYIRGNGYRIDLEPRRSVEISSLLKSNLVKPIDFKDRSEYLKFLLDLSKPSLPWENLVELKSIAKSIILEIRTIGKAAEKPAYKEIDYAKFNLNKLKEYINYLRFYRRQIQEEIDHKNSQGLDKVDEYIEVLEKKIYSMEERPLVLERYITLGLNALNDALRIKPNYPVGDDNEPTNTAPGKVPDIECFYKDFNSICEVTLLKDRSQWFNEGQPVMRHLRDFEQTNPDKIAFCLFIAPSLHIDTIETFWMSINYGYKGKKQKIIPLTINQFVEILKTLVLLKKKKIKFTKSDLLNLYDNILDLEGVEDSDEWVKLIPEKINLWKKGVLNGISIK